MIYAYVSKHFQKLKNYYKKSNNIKNNYTNLKLKTKHLKNKIQFIHIHKYMNWLTIKPQMSLGIKKI